MADENNLKSSSESDAMSAPEAGVPEEALDILQDVLVGFESSLSSGELEGAREFLLDVMAAHPLGYLLAERLRERTTAVTEERKPTELGASAEDDDDGQKVRGAG